MKAVAAIFLIFLMRFEYLHAENTESELNTLLDLLDNYNSSSNLIRERRFMDWFNRVDVRVQDGKLIGIVDENVYGKKFISFRGIPYAKPPVGELRFKDPVPVGPWRGDKDATKYGNSCVQPSLFSDEIIGDEDCLYLNVFTTNIRPIKKRTVMVWIHGGGYFVGSGDSQFYGPDYIVQKDVVLVTLNYRLGPLGFLNLNDKVATGNQGLKDIILALRWVQQNIAAFGGDPNNVTIFGESVGSGMVHFLTIAPAAAGLFHKAISESGVMLDHWAFNEWSSPEDNVAFQLTKKLGKTTTDPKVAYDFLKTIDAKKFIEVSYPKNDTSLELFERQVNLLYTPSKDCESENPIFPENIYDFIERGVNVPFLIGCNGFEGSFFVQGNFYGNVSDEVFKEVDADFSKAISPKLLPTLPTIPVTIEELRYFYFGNKSVSQETIKSYADIIGDSAFYHGIMEVANIQTKRTSSSEPTYLYYFTYESETSPIRKLMGYYLPGTCHMEELGYLFYPSATKDMGVSPPAPGSEDDKMTNRLVQMWTDFAKTGNPTPVINELTPVKWTPVKPGNVLDYMHINEKPEMKTFHKGKERWDWENIEKSKNI